MSREGSEDDPCWEFRRAADFARSWGATLVSAGAAGHINTASGHGPWPQGRALLAQFGAQIQLAASLEMEPTRLTVRVIISPRRAAHFAR